jgi:methionyl-tRNA formyltransferase
MKIALFGEDMFTVAALHSLIESQYTVSAVVCPLNEKNPEHKFLESAAKRNNIFFISEVDINSDDIRVKLVDLQPDLIVCVHLEKVLSKKIYSIAKKAAINVHPSLLPKYRGLSPQHQALMHGDMETGVTIHYLEEEADIGDIILQVKIALTEETYIFDLLKQMLAVYKESIPHAVQLISNNDVKPIRQNGVEGSWFAKLKSIDRQIDLKQTTVAIYNLIRSVSKPYKGAFYNHITVWKSYIPNEKTAALYLEKYPEAGLYTFDDILLIRLADGILLSDDFEVI